MVICAVYGCHMRSGRDNALVKFYRIPSVRQVSQNCSPAMSALSANRRALWLLRICREDLDDARASRTGARVCSKHFVSGSPSILEDITNPDWAPSLHLGHDFFDGKRKRRKREENYETSLKKKMSIDGDVENSDDNQNEKFMSSFQSTVFDFPESSSDDEDYPLMSVLGNSKIYECITDKPPHPRSILIHAKHAYNPTSESEGTPSAHTSADDLNFKTTELEISPFAANTSEEALFPTVEPATTTSSDVCFRNVNSQDSPSVVTRSDDALSVTSKSESNFSDDDRLESEQGDNLQDIYHECTEKLLSKSISEPNNSSASGQINFVTHAEAFSAAETLLRYIMNQDEVNDVDVNFTLNLAQKIKERLN